MARSIKNTRNALFTSNFSNKKLEDTVDRSKQVTAKTKDTTEVDKIKAYKEQQAYLSSIKQLQKDIDTTSREILENAKNVGTADFKTLSNKQKILDVQEDIEDLEVKVAAAIDDGNDSLAAAYKNRIKALRESKIQLITEQRKIKVYETQNNLIKKQLEKINKLADAVKNPLKALEHFGGVIGALMMGVHPALHLNEEILELRRNFGLSA